MDSGCKPTITSLFCHIRARVVQGITSGQPPTSAKGGLFGRGWHRARGSWKWAFRPYLTLQKKSATKIPPFVCEVPPLRLVRTIYGCIHPLLMVPLATCFVPSILCPFCTCPPQLPLWVGYPFISPHQSPMFSVHSIQCALIFCPMASCFEDKTCLLSIYKIFIFLGHISSCHGGMTCIYDWKKQVVAQPSSICLLARMVVWVCTLSAGSPLGQSTNKSPRVCLLAFSCVSFPYFPFAMGCWHGGFFFERVIYL